jgi:WD40 repeat protein
MGSLENGQKVNDITVPCRNNPYEFVETMKSILESDEVSNTIQNWIDLIFGSKSKGKEAENAKNLFTEESYQESLDINKVQDKEATLRKVEFGLIPSQVMSKDCGKRDKKEDLFKGKAITDPNSVLIKYICKPVKDQTFFTKYKDLDIKVLYGFEISQDKICLVLSNNYIIEKKVNLSNFTKEFTDELINATPISGNFNKMVDYYTNNSQINKDIVYLRKLKILIMGGYYDGKINLYSIEDKKLIGELIPFELEYPITSISAGSDDDYLVVGNSIGNIVIYKINSDVNKWEIIKKIYDQISPISHINCNSDLNLWLSTTIDGYINLYTLPLCKLARTIKISTKKSSYSFLSSSPLPSIIVINDETNNSEIIVYSLNGKQISNLQLYYQLTNPIIIKDLNSNEYLAYIGKESISIMSLPHLELMANIDIKSNVGISNIFISQDKLNLYCFNKNGNKAYVIRDDVKKIHEHV